MLTPQQFSLFVLLIIDADLTSNMYDEIYILNLSFLLNGSRVTVLVCPRNYAYRELMPGV